MVFAMSPYAVVHADSTSWVHFSFRNRFSVAISATPTAS
jgi:hypothetical protein